jgi:hypothetical protein
MLLMLLVRKRNWGVNEMHIPMSNVLCSCSVWNRSALHFAAA